MKSNNETIESERARFYESVMPEYQADVRAWWDALNASQRRAEIVNMLDGSPVGVVFDDWIVDWDKLRWAQRILLCQYYAEGPVRVLM